MTKTKAILATISILAAAWSCTDSGGSGTALDRVADAETMFARGETDDARALCTKILADSDDIDKGVSAARVYLLNALLMSKVSEDSPENFEEDMAVAAKSFDKAVAASPDSVAAITAELDIAERGRVNLLRQITGYIQLPDSSLELTTDTIPDNMVLTDHIPTH